MMWVIDASVAVRWFLKNERHPHADAILQRLLGCPEAFAVPELFCFEVYAILSRMHPHGQTVFAEGVVPLLQSGIFRQPMTETLAQQGAIFVKKGLTGYDACYAALAWELKGTWLTFDNKAHRCIVKEHTSHLLGKKLPRDW